jgi:hypothetical protein
MAGAALVFSISGAAAAATGLVNGDRLIAPHSLSGGRLRDHTIARQQINLRRLGAVPLATRATTALAAGSAGNAVNAADAAHVSGYYNSGLITLAASATAPGNQEVLITKPPFSFIAQCFGSGSATTASVLVRDNTAAGAIEEDQGAGNVSAPTTLNAGDTHTVFAAPPDAGAWWRADAGNSFGVAAPNGTALIGNGSVGENVLGSQCVFQLVLLGG